MKQNLIFFAFLLFITEGNLYAQKKAPARPLKGQALIDSLLQVLPDVKEDTNKVRLLNDLLYTYSSINSDEGIKYGQQALELATKLDWKKGIANVNNAIGNVYYSKSEFPKALEYYFKSLKINEESGDKLHIELVTGNIGNIYAYQGDNAKALEYFFTALKMAEALNDTSGIGIVTGSIGSTYQLQNDYPKSLEYYFRALNISKETGDKNGIAIVTGNIGQVYRSEKDFVNAIEYEEISLKIAKEMEDGYTAAGDLYDIGNIYLLLATDTNKASRVATKNETSTSQYLPEGKTSVTIPVSKAARLSHAIDFMEQGLEMGKATGAQLVVQSCYEDLSQAYKLTGNFEKALEYANDYQVLKDSLFSKDNDEKIVKMGMKYEYEKKAAEDQKAASLKLQRQQYFTYTGIAGMLFLLGFSVIIARNNKLLSKEKKRSEDLLLNILPGGIADELKEKGVSAARPYDNVTVMFTDFVNFTNAGERMSPQALIEELHTCFKTFDEITGKYNIEKIKTIGDAYLAVCGLPVADPKHAENIVRAAIEINTFMQDRLAKLGADGSRSTFEIRIGIHSGSVVAGIVGVKKFAYDIWGDTVNTAARMEQNSLPGHINISQVTYELVKDKFNCEYRGEITAKNKGEMKMYFVNPSG